MRYLIFYVFLAFLIIGCREPKKYEVQKFEVSDCLGELKTFYFPTGWHESNTYSYEHGFIESLTYPDSSIVSILCGSTTELNPSEKFKNNIHSRKEIIFGRTVIYENVKTARKIEFDKAFDKMIE